MARTVKVGRPLLGAVLVLGLGAQAGLAEACAPYHFPSLSAVARIRDANGRWHPAKVELNASFLRIEYAAPSAPWGKVAMVSDIANGPTFVFPVAVSGPIPAKSRVTWKTSLGQALPIFRLKPDFIAQDPDIDAPRRFHGLSCYLALNPMLRNTTCLHDGVPLYVRDQTGRDVFEIMSLRSSDEPEARFRPPANLPMTDKEPAYLETLTCSGWRSDPARR